MSQDVYPVTRAGAIVEPTGTWGDPSAISPARLYWEKKVPLPSTVTFLE